MHSLCFRDITISWLNHTPHAIAVYASCSASLPPHATLASQAARYGLTWAGLAPADRASFGWRLRISRPLFPKKADADRASAGCTVGQGPRSPPARTAALARRGYRRSRRVRAARRCPLTVSAPLRPGWARRQLRLAPSNNFVGFRLPKEQLPCVGDPEMKRAPGEGR